ncbi:hypothetical protein N7532_005388 [Penicillium argentinense]|uniref:Major facilitator superfamily (MFS) profile domain-containing protein n=1 Tax=Penicillium argentinense TaxID=1131581 RepID=A0A9W9KAV6_9EURO|nr:uncharacterized protein N7532_005388 [Penicillium argentinense]KAJ5098387.1 hypothetical protein N7532_005388 [Penicillium argentinense]
MQKSSSLEKRDEGAGDELETFPQDEKDVAKVEVANVIIPNRNELEKKFIRKLDMRLLPLMMLIYILNYLDRNNIATARLGTLEKDLSLHGNQYNTIISLFFVGYILTQVPTNMILNKMRPSRFLPAVMCAWAIVSTCTGAVQNYQGLLALRFVLGFVEAPFFPGALFLFSSWYTKKELAARISILYVAAQISGAFGGLLGSAIMSGMDGKAGLPAWRWLFIIEGSATIPIAFVAMFLLPDYPETTKWLTDEERILAVTRLAEEANESDHDETRSKWEGLRLAFADPVLYIIWLMQLGLNTAACFTNFFPTIVETLGYGTTKTLLLSAPPYMFAAILSVMNSFHSDKVSERWLHVVWPQVFSSIGFIISAVTLNVAARYISTFMMMSIYGSFGCILSWVSTSLPRPRSKRAVAYAVVNAGSNFASIYASYFYPETQGPRYWQANVANVAFSGMCIVMATVLHFTLRWRNRQLEKAADADVDAGVDPTSEDSMCQQLAMRWNCHPHYRYIT